MGFMALLNRLQHSTILQRAAWWSPALAMMGLAVFSACHTSSSTEQSPVSAGSIVANDPHPLQEAAPTCPPAAEQEPNLWQQGSTILWHTLPDDLPYGPEEMTGLRLSKNYTFSELTGVNSSIFTSMHSLAEELSASTNLTLVFTPHLREANLLIAGADTLFERQMDNTDRKLLGLALVGPSRHSPLHPYFGEIILDETQDDCKPRSFAHGTQGFTVLAHELLHVLGLVHCDPSVPRSASVMHAEIEHVSESLRANDIGWLMRHYPKPSTQIAEAEAQTAGKSVMTVR